MKFNGAVIKEVPLFKERMTIGRKPDNDIVIGHPTISGSHGVIRREGEKFVIEDLNSTNGTFVNGNRVKTSALKNRDRIGVAGHILEFVTENDAAATPESPTSPAAAAAWSSPVAKAPASSTPSAATPKPVPSIKTPEPSAPVAAAAAAPASVPDPEVASRLIAEGGAAALAAPATMKVISGGVNGQTEVTLKDLVTYIGTAATAHIKIKGFLAPDFAAAITRRSDGYFLKAVKPGYPKVNGHPVNEQILLENGAAIEVGGTNLVFYTAEKKKTS
ncbi:MAG: FHA domain-containing protein [Elusimicrobia bacterium]|nr:FHA domain-containing protein [Elusimicrobiota bacterium]